MCGNRILRSFEKWLLPSPNPNWLQQVECVVQFKTWLRMDTNRGTGRVNLPERLNKAIEFRQRTHFPRSAVTDVNDDMGNASELVSSGSNIWKIEFLQSSSSTFRSINLSDPIKIIIIKKKKTRFRTFCQGSWQPLMPLVCHKNCRAHCVAGKRCEYEWVERKVKGKHVYSGHRTHTHTLHT